MSENLWLQFGALGIVAMVIIYIVKWMTTKLNGAIDENTRATRENTSEVSKTKEVMLENRKVILTNADMVKRLLDEHKDIFTTMDKLRQWQRELDERKR